MTYTWEKKDFYEAAELTMEREPKAYPYCYFAYGDAPGGIGGGEGVCLWFKDYDEMERFFIEQELLNQGWLTKGEPEYEKILTEVKEGLKLLRSSNIGEAKKGFDKVNQALKNRIQLAWYCSFQDIFNGKRVFNEFHANNHKKVLAEGCSEEEFIEYLTVP